MSVTFFPSQSPVVGYRFECHCGVVAAEFETYEGAHGFLSIYKDDPYQLDGCTDELCPMYPQIMNVYADAHHEGLNLNNENAADILRVLGLIEPGQDPALFKPEVQWVGELAASDFLGRVMVAQAISPESAEKIGHEKPGRGATMFEGGREAGYIQRTLSQLADVADWAAKHERTMCWG
ncbi:hypothetical protein [Aeromicrobium sp. 179-A 4D2 NHS]|uniref:hypothetical protein n=1 Tax=Aeromicrobium sp. 179-A 4D2 NHS TaxID=3142375 RepID=UPI00399F90E5